MEIEWESCPQITSDMVALDFVNEGRWPGDRSCKRWISLARFSLLGFHISVSEISQVGSDRGPRAQHQRHEGQTGVKFPSKRMANLN